MADEMITTKKNNAVAAAAAAAAAEQQRIAELEAALEHQARQLEAIRKTSDALFSHPSVDAMVRATLRIALDILRADAGTVFLYDEKNDSLVFRYVIGGGGESLIGQSIPLSQPSVAGTVFRTSVPEMVGDVTNRADHNRDVGNKTGYHTQSMMTVPVKRTDAAPIGVMQVLNARVPFTQRDLEVLEALCSQAATGIEHQQLAEKAQQAEIVHVIGDISHDIKNMLTPILTGVWTLEPMLDRLFVDLDEIRKKCPETETWADDVARVADAVRFDYGWMLQNTLNAAEQVQSRTKEIADAMKGELSPPFFEMSSLNETCKDVAVTLRVVAENAQIDLNLDLDPELPFAEFDRKQMYNALYNLVNNAIPFTPPSGSVTVRTRGPEQTGEADTLLVQVQDTGKGMSEKIRSRLFKDIAVSTTPGGTGLGTRIVAGVVRRHNGTITVDSEEGKGSMFTIRLPLRHL